MDLRSLRDPSPEAPAQAAAPSIPKASPSSPEPVQQREREQPVDYTANTTLLLMTSIFTVVTGYNHLQMLAERERRELTALIVDIIQMGRQAVPPERRADSAERFLNEGFVTGLFQAAQARNLVSPSAEVSFARYQQLQQKLQHLAE